MALGFAAEAAIKTQLTKQSNQQSQQREPPIWAEEENGQHMADNPYNTDGLLPGRSDSRSQTARLVDLFLFFRSLSFLDIFVSPTFFLREREREFNCG